MQKTVLLWILITKSTQSCLARKAKDKSTLIPIIPRITTFLQKLIIKRNGSLKIPYIEQKSTEKACFGRSTDPDLSDPNKSGFTNHNHNQKNTVIFRAKNETKIVDFKHDSSRGPKILLFPR